MARKPAKPKPGGETAPSTMKEKIAKLKMSRQETKKEGKFAGPKPHLSIRKGIASTGMLRRGKQR